MTAPASSPQLPQEDVKRSRPWPIRMFILIAAQVAILLAAGTVAVVVMKARHRNLMRAREVNPSGVAGSYVSAQLAYHRRDHDGDGQLEYTPDLALLVTQLDENGEPLSLMSDAFARAHGPDGTPKHGYLFLELESIAGRPIDWAKDCAVCATPAQYGVTGSRTFIVKTDGWVWGKDLGKSEFVKDCPADPVAEGWEKVR